MQLFKYLAIIVIQLFYVSYLNGQTKYDIKKSLQTAKLNNPYLKVQAFNIAISQADTITAKLRPNPVLNNQSLQLVNPIFFHPNTSWNSKLNRQVWWQVTKPFVLPTHKENKLNFARESVVVQEKNFSEMERNLFHDVGLKWIDVWVAKKQLDILILAKNNMDTLVEINRLKFKDNVINQTDLLRTELLLNQYKVKIKSTEQAYQNELQNLRFLVGVTNEIEIDTSDHFNFLFTSNLDSIIQNSIVNRGDIQTSIANIKVAEANIKLQKSTVLPTPELGVIINPQNSIPYVGFFGTVSVPIFSRNQGEISKYTIVKLQAEQNLVVNKTQAQFEITNAYHTYYVQKANAEVYMDYLKQSETILKNVKYAYLRGATNIVDYLEAQRSWIDIQQSYYETLQLYKQSYINLLYSTGLINQLAL